MGTGIIGGRVVAPAQHGRRQRASDVGYRSGDLRKPGLHDSTCGQSERLDINVPQAWGVCTNDPS
jgi:hypothetical protein